MASEQSIANEAIAKAVAEVTVVPCAYTGGSRLSRKLLSRIPA